MYFNRKGAELVPLTYFTNCDVSGAACTSFSLRAFDVSVVSVIKNVRLDHLSQRAMAKINKATSQNPPGTAVTLSTM